jgi:CHRD domain
MKIYQTLLLLVTPLLSFALCQNTVPAVQQSNYRISPMNNSGASGAVDFIDYGLGNTLIVVNMTGLAGQHIYPAHIHAGSCGSNGDVVIPLESVDGTTGLSITLTTMTYTNIAQGDYYLNVHQSPEDLTSIISCGEIGSEAQVSTPQEPSSVQGSVPGATLQEPPMQEPVVTPLEPTPTATPGTIDQTGVAQGSELPTGVKPEEFATSMRTEGYGIFPVNGGSITGQIQVAEEADGLARVIVTLRNFDPGQRFPLEIRQGDCGPDRPLLVALNDLPSVPDDPTASWTTTTLRYEEIAEGNNFIYVYSPDQSGTVIACGEVGIGANR